MKKKNELEAELLSAENPLQLVKTDYFDRVKFVVESSFEHISYSFNRWTQITARPTEKYFRPPQYDVGKKDSGN